MPRRVGRDWLGRKDSNLRMADPKSAALPLGDSPAWRCPQPQSTLTSNQIVQRVVRNHRNDIGLPGRGPRPPSLVGAAMALRALTSPWRRVRINPRPAIDNSRSWRGRRGPTSGRTTWSLPQRGRPWPPIGSAGRGSPDTTRTGDIIATAFLNCCRHPRSPCSTSAAAKGDCHVT